MADERSLGEIGRAVDRVERQLHEAQRAMDDRITKLASDMVPTTLWSVEHKTVVEDVHDVRTDMQAGLARVESAVAEKFKTTGREIAGLKTEIKAVREERAKHSINTWQITIALVAALAAVALVVEGLLQSGGH